MRSNYRTHLKKKEIEKDYLSPKKWVNRMIGKKPMLIPLIVYTT